MPGHRILVVDDEAPIAFMISMLLTAEGYVVSTAANGVEALQSIERSRPDLVMLDMRMPGMDGWGFARALRDRGVSLPILVMTAAQDAGQWAAEIGADAYLAKPFDIFEMLDAVARMTSRVRGEQWAQASD